MNRMELIGMLSQAGNTEIGKIFGDFMKGAARYALVEAMEEEIVLLCGKKNKPRKGAYRRAGSAPGSYYSDNRSESMPRPRVRKKERTGKEREYRLRTYEAAQDGSGLKEAIISAFVAGVSTRKQCRVNPAHRRISKSSVSRLWRKKGSDYVRQLRARNLADTPYLILMLDGVYLCKDMTAIVAMGITEDGTKHMLDFEIGSTENTAVCTALTERLSERGFTPAARHLFAILDGSKALKKAVLALWPRAVIQTCLVHVERTIGGRLAKKYLGDLHRVFKDLRKAANLEAAFEVYEKLDRFVKKHTAAGLESLHNARPFMLTLWQLNVPDTLNKALLSTNSIENSIRNMRAIIGRVTRWRSNTDMANSWIACAMMEAEKGLRRIPGYSDLAQLKGALDRDLAPHGGHIPWKNIDSYTEVA